MFRTDILCVTNRGLCGEDLPKRIEKIAAAPVGGIILREKDLPEDAYRKLAARIMDICRRHGTPCILHGFAETAFALGAEALHLPLPILRTLTESERACFRVLGASCHSLTEAREAETLGCTYITAGHIFATGCKPGLTPRGLDFLREICENVSVPVYAIGGISAENYRRVKEAGAVGACVMSALMQCADVGAYLEGFANAPKPQEH